MVKSGIASLTCPLSLEFSTLQARAQTVSVKPLRTTVLAAPAAPVRAATSQPPSFSLARQPSLIKAVRALQIRNRLRCCLPQEIKSPSRLPVTMCPWEARRNARRRRSWPNWRSWTSRVPLALSLKMKVSINLRIQLSLEKRLQQPVRYFLQLMKGTKMSMRIYSLLKVTVMRSPREVIARFARRSHSSKFSKMNPFLSCISWNLIIKLSLHHP